MYKYLIGAFALLAAVVGFFLWFSGTNQLPEVSKANRANSYWIPLGTAISRGDWLTYKKDGTRVLYSSADRKHYQILPAADSATFLVSAANGNWAKDKNHVYDDGRVVSACLDYSCTQQTYFDPITFDIVPSSAVNDLFQYVKDKSGVYYDNPDLRRWVLLKNADPHTFVSFFASNETYGKDKSTVWFGDRVVAGADASSFTASDLFGKDAQHVYYMGQVIQGADPNTFTALGTLYSKDAQHVFKGASVVPNADPQTYQIP